MSNYKKPLKVALLLGMSIVATSPLSVLAQSGKLVYTSPEAISRDFEKKSETAAGLVIEDKSALAAAVSNVKAANEALKEAVRNGVEETVVLGLIAEVVSADGDRLVAASQFVESYRQYLKARVNHYDGSLDSIEEMKTKSIIVEDDAFAELQELLQQQPTATILMTAYNGLSSENQSSVSGLKSMLAANAESHGNVKSMYGELAKLAKLDLARSASDRVFDLREAVEAVIFETMSKLSFASKFQATIKEQASRLHMLNDELLSKLPAESGGQGVVVDSSIFM